VRPYLKLKRRAPTCRAVKYDNYPSQDFRRTDILENKKQRVSMDVNVFIDHSADEIDEEAEGLEATQYGEQVRRQSRKGIRAAENGIIESVTCINFMCHKQLHVPIGPLINFVIGHNGSGKSAVLTALTICLGGKASSTNRGGSLKSFIKEGEE